MVLATMTQPRSSAKDNIFVSERRLFRTKTLTDASNAGCFPIETTARVVVRTRPDLRETGLMGDDEEATSTP